MELLISQTGIITYNYQQVINNGVDNSWNFSSNKPMFTGISEQFGDAVETHFGEKELFHHDFHGTAE